VTGALVHLTPLEGVQVHERAPGPPVPAREGPRRAGRGDVPGISVTDRAEVWRLSDTIVTEVRPRDVPVTPSSRKSDFASSL